MTGVKRDQLPPARSIAGSWPHRSGSEASSAFNGLACTTFAAFTTEATNTASSLDSAVTAYYSSSLPFSAVIYSFVSGIT